MLYRLVKKKLPYQSIDFFIYIFRNNENTYFNYYLLINEYIAKTSNTRSLNRRNKFRYTEVCKCK